MSGEVEMDGNNNLNGIDTEALKQTMAEVSQNPAKGSVKFRVVTTWKGQTKSETEVEGYELGGQEIKRSFKFSIDEPVELLGQNTAPNPQEFLMAALNSCVMNTYVIAAAMKGVRLEKVEIETKGELDLRGFLGIDKTIKPGYEEINYTVRIKGDGSKEKFDEIHQLVKSTSPNYWNIANAIKLNATLVVE